MTTVRSLLAGLQDHERRTPTSVRHLLLELASCCRCGDAKGTILADGLDVLLALAADNQELPANETLEVLLELLVLLLLDNPKAKAKAAHCGAVELGVRCLHELSTSTAGGKRRAKILRRALELVDLLTHTTEADQQEIQKLVVKQILEIMARPGEDTSVLLRATDTLGRFVDGNAERIRVAANDDAIHTLIEMLKLSGEKVDLKRTACDVLMIMSEASGMFQMMISQNVIEALCHCLRIECQGRELEIGVVRLLLRLATEARVYGQIIHEGMVPLLFRVIERNSNVREVTSTVCSIIADISDFARQCKLDLFPFIDQTYCRGQVLVLAATCHAQEATIVDSTFRFFVNISNNPTDVPQVINSETIEGLLSLYVLAGGSGYLAELAGHVVQVISRLCRSTIQNFVIREEDITLPALFLCLRNYHDDVRFASQVFAILAKHWKTQTKSIQGITGYVGVAVEILCRVIPSSGSWRHETVEICNFIREMLLAQDGAEVVLSCGGKDLLEILHSHLSASNHDALSDIETSDENTFLATCPPQRFASVCYEEQIIRRVMHMLQTAVLGCADISTTPDYDQSLETAVSDLTARPGDSDYEGYITKVSQMEADCRFQLMHEAKLDDFNSNDTKVQVTGDICATVSSSSVEYPILTERDEAVGDTVAQAVAGNGDTDDAQATTTPVSSGGEEGADNEEKLAEDENDDDSDEDDDNAEKTNGVIQIPNMCSIPRNYLQSPHELRGSISSKTTSRDDSSTSYFFNHLQDNKWFYVDSSLVKYPKHPSRMSRDGQNNREEEFVLEEPNFLEPCNLPDTEDSSRFIEEAVARRSDFIKSDASMRARIVYENRAMVRDSQHDCVPGIPAFLVNSCVTQHDVPYFVPDKTKAFSQLSTALTFDSSFESGNLERAIRIGEHEYDLILRHDFNSSGHMQWFYFAVSNIQGSNSNDHGESPRWTNKYRFNIINLCKSNSLFNQGLQPVVYSVKDAHQKGRGWVRSGTDIHYFANSFMRPPRNASNFAGFAPTDTAATPTATSSTLGQTYYTLTFTLEFWNTDDTFLIAHSYPYTLTMHRLHLDNILHRSGRDTRHILKYSSLCTTLSGRNCDLLTISDFSTGHLELKTRRAVFITARVHPGESQASWMMRGVIDFLLGDSCVARALRRLFVFQVIPMLNPDGVYYGNSRCGLSACDLNRQWQNPSKALHPTIFHAKELLANERSSRGVAFFCDMHGHSRKKNVFMYGCDTKRRPNPAARSFAKLFSMQQTANKYFSLPDCSFKVSKDKETTARVVVANELKISWSFTMEASFCGANYGELQNNHFNTRHLHEVGMSLCETLFQASVHDTNARDKLVTMVDDDSVCFPKLIEGYLRDVGAVSDSVAMDDDTSASTRVSFQKVKSGSAKKVLSEVIPNNIRRKGSKALGGVTARLTAPIEVFGSGRRRKSSRQLGKTQTDGTRDIAAFVTDDSPSNLDLTYIPPPKLSGRKLRSKYPRIRRTKSSPDGHVKARRKAIPSIVSDSSNLAGVEDVTDEKRGVLSNDYATDQGVMPLMSPTKLLTGVSGPPSSSVRAYPNPDPTYVRSPKSISFPYPSNALGTQLRDPIVLPSPVGNLMSRSPKAPANRIRFRGAGRQFAAVNSIPRTSIHDILRSDSEVDLINASTMIIRHRTGSNNATAGVDEKKSSSPPPEYLSFPSVT